MAIQFSKIYRTVGVLIFGILAMVSQTRSQSATNSLAATNRSSTQTTNQDSYNLEKGINEFGIWGGGSFDSSTVIGTAEDRKFLTVGLHYGRILGGSRNVAYEYTVDVVPVAVVFQPDFARAFNRRPDQAIYGAGISPIGFKANFNRRGRVKPFASTSGGFFYFRRPVPADVTSATKFNFTFEFSDGIQIFTRSSRAITLGYKFHHISNANRSEVNPGLDNNIFYVGFSLFK